jgi:hypothetical protein
MVGKKNEDTDVQQMQINKKTKKRIKEKLLAISQVTPDKERRIFIYR